MTETDPVVTPKTKPASEMTPAELAACEAYMKEMHAGLEGLHALQNERWEARTRNAPVAWVITEGEYLSGHCHHRKSLDQIIDDELTEGEELTPGYDRIVWHGMRAMAILRAGPNGTMEIIRVDGKKPVVTRKAYPDDDR